MKIDKQPIKDLSAILGFEVPMLPAFFTVLFGEQLIDVPALDEMLSKRDGDYNHLDCTYKGTDYTMSRYLEQKYGEEAAALFNQLTDTK